MFHLRTMTMKKMRTKINMRKQDNVMLIETRVEKLKLKTVWVDKEGKVYNYIENEPKK